MPSVSPFSTVRSTPSTACTCPTVCLKMPDLIGKCLTSPSTRRISSPAAGRRCGRRVRRRRRLRLGLGHDGSSTSAPMTCCAASSSAKWHADTCVPPSPNGAQLRNLGPTHRSRPARGRAARVERAAGRRREQARRLPGDRLEPLEVGVEPREAVHQPDRVRVARGLKIVVDVAELDDAARVHHDDAVGELGDQAEVVRDEDDRRVRLLLRGAHDLDDLRLDRDVERRRRLVGDEDPRARSRSPSRSSRAGASRPRTRAGTGSTRRSADGTPTSSSSCDGSLASRRRRSSPELCVWIASEIWSPIVKTGFSDVIGSWKIIAISPPRISRSSFFGIVSRSRPSYSASPLTILPGRLRDQPEHGHHGDALPGARLSDDARASRPGRGRRRRR